MVLVLLWSTLGRCLATIRRRYPLDVSAVLEVSVSSENKEKVAEAV
jgi:hypothetical protein